MKKLLLILLLSVIPLALAQIEVTEVMSNPTGSDTNREWIEIYAAEEVDLTSWRLVEGGSNHKLSGNVKIPANTYAIIASDTVKFKLDNPSYSGLLIDSAFSLNNNGEELAFRTPDGNTTGKLTYISVSEGNTACLISGTWKECSPTPGAANQMQQEQPRDTEEEQNVNLESRADIETTEEPTEAKDKILVEVISAPDEARAGEELKINVRLKNTFSESKTIEIQSYIYEGKSVKTGGGWSGNTQELTLKAGEEKEITLTNTVKADAATGEFKLRVRAKIGTKTYDADQEIKITEKTYETVEEPEPLTGSAVEEPEDSPEEEPKTEPKTIYINKQTGSLNKAALIFIIVLVIAVVFLVISLKNK